MNEPPAIRLSLKDVWELLDVQTIPGKARELERLRRWIERMVKSRGKDYVWENRQDLISQWEQYAKTSFKSCV
jgi:hypothetical protein